MEAKTQTAIIDLGTNTFNLLIADVDITGGYQIMLDTKQAAKLGKEGINNKTITAEAIDRGIEALKIHLNTISNYKVTKVVCIATSAIRSASNGDEFVSKVEEVLGLEIQVIDGLHEAQLIFDGIKQVVPLGDEKVMILDIGGGSNEFVMANKEGVFWKHSFDLGMARLLDQFTPSNPITEKEIVAIETHFRQELSLLFNALKEHDVDTMIGSAGSFDTIANLLAGKLHPHLNMSMIVTYDINLSDFVVLHQMLLKSTLEERNKMERMDADRVEMIVLASIFINFIVRECHIKKILQCTYSLKEGAIYQMINNQL